MISDWLRILRPAHWVKNLFVLAPLLFARQLFDLELWLVSAMAAWLFCLLSSSVYAFNDVIDAERDRVHPLKADRPVAAGRIRPAAALAASAGLGLVALAGAIALSRWLALCAAAYLAINVLYSMWLKRLAFFDVVLIAAGFVLRVVAGALAIEVEISVWLVVCTFFLACLLGFGKRRHELWAMGEGNRQTRPALRGYSRRSLQVAEWLTAGVTLAAYVAYTVAPGTVQKFGSYNLLFTLPFPIFGIIRYRKLVGSRRATPTEALVTDGPSLLNLAAWVIAVVIGLYDLL